MENISSIAAYISAVGIILTPIIFILKKYNHIIAEQKKSNGWNKRQQLDIKDIKENNSVQNKALLAMARSMKASGFNHTIDIAIESLETTILEQQKKSNSYSDNE